MLSDLVHGEVIGLAPERTEESLAELLTTHLDARQRAAVEAVCTDMHRPYLNAVTRGLPAATVVLDKFHVLQHAGAALDEVRRHEFFRAGPVMRRFGRGKRWLLLRRWKTVRGSKRDDLRALFAANRRLFKAYVLREELDRLWTYHTRDGVATFLWGWLKALRWQRLPEMEARRHAGQALRRDRRILRSPCPLRCRRIAEHDHQRRHSPWARHEGRRDVAPQAQVGEGATHTIIEGSRKFLYSDAHSNR